MGRLKDMIISGGENIYPVEVENVLSEHPGVVAVALIGVPDAHWGEVGRAVVVPRRRPGHRGGPDHLRPTRLARYKVPKRVVLRGRPAHDRAEQGGQAGLAAAVRRRRNT